MSTFKNLLIWQKSMTLVTKTYEITQLFPKEELFGLTSQIRRCQFPYPAILRKATEEEAIKNITDF